MSVVVQPQATRRLDAKGTLLSKQICLRYIYRHQVAFREYFMQRVSRRRFLMRYSFMPVLLALDQGDTLLAAGRGSGKSYTVLEPYPVQRALTRPGEETLITSFRKTHVADRCERIIDYFELKKLKPYVRRIIRSPHYMIQLWNDHIIYGISVGDDPEARMAQGKHASSIVVEEAHQYPKRAAEKLQGAQDPRGSSTLMIGVPDGRVDTPFRNADTENQSFKGRRFHISKRTDPYYNQTQKFRDLAMYGGSEESDLFMGEVDALWGSPSWGAWDLETIQRCQIDGMPPKWWPVELSGREFKEARTDDKLDLLVQRSLRFVVPNVISRHRRIMAIDVGYSQPSEAGIFEEDRASGKWKWLLRIRLVNRMEHYHQEKILTALMHLFEVHEIGIDATEGEGRAIAFGMEQTFGVDRVHRVAMNEVITTGYVERPEEVPEEVQENIKLVATRQTRTLFSESRLTMPIEPSVILEFNQEKESKGQDGIVRIKTPENIHVPDMFRVFSMVLFLNNPPVLQGANLTEGMEVEFSAAGDNPWAAPEVLF